jgi:hypothetical protein
MYATRKSSNEPNARALPFALRAARRSTFPSQPVDLTFLTFQFHARARLPNLKLSTPQFRVSDRLLYGEALLSRAREAKKLKTRASTRVASKSSAVHVTYTLRSPLIFFSTRRISGTYIKKHKKPKIGAVHVNTFSQRHSPTTHA